MTTANPHVRMLEEADEALREVSVEPVFIGGATISLHLDDPAGPEIRATKDVDCVVSIASYAAYAAIEEELRRAGFHPPMSEDGPMCRWIREGLRLDVLPSEPEIIGFSESRWFDAGLEHTVEHGLPSGRTIRTFDVMHTIAAKIEAHEDRHGDDYFGSKDLEDVVAILDGRTTIFDELADNRDVCAFVRDWFRDFETRRLQRVVGAHLREPDRRRLLLDRLDDVLESRTEHSD